MHFRVRLLSRRRGARQPQPPALGEFDVQVTLRKGDRIVRRDAQGRIAIEEIRADGGVVLEVSRRDDRGAA